MAHYVPNEHYNWYWDKYDFGEKEPALRNRFNKLYNRYYKGPHTPDRYANFVERLKKLRGRLQSNLISHEELALDDIEIPGEEDVLYDASATAEEGVGLIDEGAAGGVIESAEAVGETLVGEVATEGLGIPIAIGAGTAAGGALIYKTLKSGIQVPFTKNVGPGNEVNTDPTLTGVDLDAAEHDLNYAKAIEEENEVADLDRDTAIKFGDHFAEDPYDLTALSGYIGLKTKEAVERHTGQLYPHLTKGKYNYGSYSYVPIEC